MIVITGAAGFIGSNLAHSFKGEFDDLLLVDKETNRLSAANFAGLMRYRFIQLERLMFELKMDFIRPSAIYHLGAISSTTETDWWKLKSNNVEVSQDLWNHAADRQIPFIYASSAATYGDGSRGFDDRTPAEALLPLNLYGKSKNDFDAWALSRSKEGEGSPSVWAGLKFFNVYGPRELHKGRMASVVLHAFNQIKTTGVVKLFRSNEPGLADGGHRRDFVFVDDCVAHMRWLATGKAPKGVYNSGTATPRSFLDLANAVFAALELPPWIEYIDMPADLIGKYQSYTCAEMGKLRAAGCDAPATSLEAGVKQTVQWLSEHHSS